MKSIRNFLTDIIFQFRISGALVSRIICVVAYWSFYEFNRIRGLSRDSSRLIALDSLSRLGSTRRLVSIILPDSIIITLDIFAASFMPKEFFLEKTYGKLPQFIPQSGQVVIDVGAHCGMFSLVAAKKVGPKGKVVAIEPCSDNFQILSKNKDSNHLDNLTLLAEAVSYFNGEANLFVATLVSGGHSLIFQSEPEPGIPLRSSITVPVRMLDGILRDLGILKIDLIKIDVEGSALGVLKGASATLAYYPRLVMEVEGGETEIYPVRSYLKNLGYRVAEYDGILYAEI